MPAYAGMTIANLSLSRHADWRFPAKCGHQRVSERPQDFALHGTLDTKSISLDVLRR
jgi:hypothetical protein